MVWGISSHDCYWDYYLALLLTLRPSQNGRLYADDIFVCIFLNKNVRISTNISSKFISKGPINGIQASVEIMAGHKLGDKPLSEPKLLSLLTIYASLGPNELMEN